MADEGGFPIAGIGASAGGIEALEGFFRGLPASPGVALVIVTHLSPDRESLLPQIIAGHTTLPVVVATDGALVEVDHVYVMPAGATLGMRDGRLVITILAGRREPKPIDVFLSALAADQGERAVAVVLSGGDGDGTLGVKAVKEHGGIAFAQAADGFGPSQPSMPDSAIGTGLVDFVLPVGQMGERLAAFATHGLGMGHEIASADEGRGATAHHAIIDVLRHQTGHDFSGYKLSTFQRRVRRRMQVTQSGSEDAYLEVLRREAAEVHALFRDLLINVTSFFRDAEAFEALTREVMPKLFEGRGAGDAVRVWVPGCATGEEVYSIAILLREQMERLTAMPRVQVFASDIDEHALSIARAGRYSLTLLDAVSPERRRFFVPDGGSAVVAKDIRDLCVFSPHSVVRDPPFSRMDLISCRNLLVYFGNGMQREVVPIFHYALRPSGYLFLGTSENVGQFGDLFAPVDKAHRIFRARETGAHHMPVRRSLAPGPSGAAAATRFAQGGASASALREKVGAHVLERFAPPHVVVNAEGEIVHYSGRTGKYLEASSGQPTRHLLSLARKWLRLDLRALLQGAVERDHVATRERIPVEGDDGRVQEITLTVAPMPDREGEDRLFLVLFADDGPSLSRDETRDVDVARTDVAGQLEHELRDTRERLQSLIEEYETALEELKASNEELVSVNEELQSANEELEAAKEEQQSLNEELQTINAELNAKIEALDLANSDLQNLFDSTDIATVFLDRNLVIRSFTPAVTKVFNILPGDRGRPITDFSTRLRLDRFAAAIETVLRTGAPAERHADHEVTGSHYLLRVSPYRNAGDEIEGVVVAFVDVTTLRGAEHRLRLLIGELQHRTRNLLGIVQAIARQTLADDQGLRPFMARLGALGRVQGLLGEVAPDRVDLGTLVRLELLAHGSDVGDSRITITGPPVSLALERVQIVALALHELATNAVKHGALGTPAGALDVSWSVEGAGSTRRLVLDWRERNVPMGGIDREHRGYGRALIERALSFTLRATTRIEFGDDGVRCRIEMPFSPDPAEGDEADDVAFRPMPGGKSPQHENRAV